MLYLLSFSVFFNVLGCRAEKKLFVFRLQNVKCFVCFAYNQDDALGFSGHYKRKAFVCLQPFQNPVKIKHFYVAFIWIMENDFIIFISCLSSIIELKEVYSEVSGGFLFCHLPDLYLLCFSRVPT